MVELAQAVLSQVTSSMAYPLAVAAWIIIYNVQMYTFHTNFELKHHLSYVTDILTVLENRSKLIAMNITDVSLAMAIDYIRYSNMDFLVSKDSKYTARSHRKYLVKRYFLFKIQLFHISTCTAKTSLILLKFLWQREKWTQKNKIIYVLLLLCKLWDYKY